MDIADLNVFTKSFRLWALGLTRDLKDHSRS